MRILGIETSCDETALAIVEATHQAASDNKNGSLEPHFSLVGDALISQIDIHKPYGGVFPAIAKREHAKNLIPLLHTLLTKTGLEKSAAITLDSELKTKVAQILEREHDLLNAFIEYISTIEKPAIDAIAVTHGPGLEPALWVGVNFAQALGAVWNVPVIPTNHMEGHIISPLLSNQSSVLFPAVALLISGGHTELVEVAGWGQYRIIGKTQDDAVGEAYDKVARLLDLSYPGGPPIAALAQKSRDKKYPKHYTLPRPMITSNDGNFSFSGLKTAVLYALKKDPATTPELRADLAREFEDAVTDVLIKKTQWALEQTRANSLIIGGGVIANTHLRRNLATLATKNSVSLHIPDQKLTTDNAIMIAMAGYITLINRMENNSVVSLKAQGNLSL